MIFFSGFMRIRAHPHSRGENSKSSRILVSWSGSSPLTRGKLGRTHQERISRGLIPTHAGKTRTRSARATHSRAHPHSRGENLYQAGVDVIQGGSSPLTRGKLVDRFASEAAGGLIPTHAGKTSTATRWVAAFTAHPHSRGENEIKIAALQASQGSSPLTRGKRSRSPR